MSQHDMVIDNGPGLSVRTDMNAAIQALASVSAGPIEPTTMYPGQLWLDTSVAPNGQLRQRNQANTAWVAPVLGQFQTSASADLSYGFRTAPAQWVWNDKADFTGLDVMALTEAGVLGLAGTAPEFDFRDAARIRQKLAPDLVNNKLMATIFNAAGTQLRTGEVFDTGNSPASFTGAMYQKLASGLVINAGNAVTDASLGNANVTFAAAFPSGVFAVVANANNASAAPATVTYPVSVTNLGNSGCSVQARSVTNGGVVAGVAITVRYIAIGF